MGAARAVPGGFSALSLRAAREGGARPRPGLPRALRRGHRHQLFARFLLQVRAGVEGLSGWAARLGSQVARGFWGLGSGAWRRGCSRGALPGGNGVSEIGVWGLRRLRGGAGSAGHGGYSGEQRVHPDVKE